jgi:hypothetical protein
LSLSGHWLPPPWPPRRATSPRRSRRRSKSVLMRSRDEGGGIGTAVLQWIRCLLQSGNPRPSRTTPIGTATRGHFTRSTSAWLSVSSEVERLIRKEKPPPSGRGLVPTCLHIGDKRDTVNSLLCVRRTRERKNPAEQGGAKCGVDTGGGRVTYRRFLQRTALAMRSMCRMSHPIRIISLAGASALLDARQHQGRRA